MSQALVTPASSAVACLSRVFFLVCGGEGGRRVPKWLLVYCVVSMLQLYQLNALQSSSNLPNVADGTFYIKDFKLLVGFVSLLCFTFYFNRVLSLRLL